MVKHTQDCHFTRLIFCISKPAWYFNINYLTESTQQSKLNAKVLTPQVRSVLPVSLPEFVKTKVPTTFLLSRPANFVAILPW